MRFDLHATLKQAFLFDRFAEADILVLDLEDFQEAGTFDNLYTALVEQTGMAAQEERKDIEEQQDHQIRIKIYAILAQLQKWRDENFPGKFLTIRYLQISYIDDNDKIHGNLSVLVSTANSIEHQGDSEEIYYTLSPNPTDAVEYQFDVNFGDLFPGSFTKGKSVNNPAALSIRPVDMPHKANLNLEQRAQLNIMLVDDGAVEISLLKMLVKQIFGEELMNHITLAVATNGKDAVEQTEKLINEQGRSFNFITMDYHMPVKNGYRAIEEIRTLESPLNEESTIIGVSNLAAGTEDYNNFTNALGGTDNLLGKPILTHKAELEAKLTPLKDQLELAIQRSMGENCSSQSDASAATLKM